MYMQVLNTFRQVIDTASALKDITDQNKTYVFNVEKPGVFYLQMEQAQITIKRWNEPTISFSMKLQMSMGWRMATEQDEQGVYVVALRRKVVGSLSRAIVEVNIPIETHLILKLQQCALNFGEVDGIIEVPPPKPNELTQSQHWKFTQTISKY